MANKVQNIKKNGYNYSETIEHNVMLNSLSERYSNWAQIYV